MTGQPQIGQVTVSEVPAAALHAIRDAVATGQPVRAATLRRFHDAFAALKRVVAGASDQSVIVVLSVQEVVTSSTI